MNQNLPELQVRLSSERFFRVADTRNPRMGATRIAGIGFVPNWLIADRRINQPYPNGGYRPTTSVTL